MWMHNKSQQCKPKCDSRFSLSLKLLLYPITHVYTCKCATNIVEIYEHSLVVR